MYFVSRWREESPFSKRVVTLPDATVLDWFRRGREQEDPEAWIESELNGYVYGLESIFDKAQELNLPAPQSVDELRELLHRHLYVEGDKSDFIRLREHALRVRTDDDEVDLAYYFVDEEAVAAAPDRFAFLLHDTWPLPTGVGEPGAVLSPGVRVRVVGPEPAAPESVFSVRLGWDSPDTVRNLDLAGALVFPGLSLPDLAGYLRGVEDFDGWPSDARLLRALVAPGEDDIGRALECYARLPGYDPASADIDRQAGPLPAEAMVRLEVNVAQVARYINRFFGYDQWLLFDIRWAAAHPDLARSLLRYASHWDPFKA